VGQFSTLSSCWMFSGFMLQRCCPKPFMAPITSEFGIALLQVVTLTRDLQSQTNE